MGFIHQRQVVGNLLGILDHGLRLLQVLQREVELAQPAINLAQLNVGARVLRVGVSDDLVLLQGFIGLPVFVQALGEAPDRVQVVAIECYGLLIGLNGFLVIFLLIVSAAERGIQFRRPAGLGNGCQRLGSLPIVTFLVVEHR